MQDEEQIERLRRDRRELQRLARHLEHHVQEARDVFEIVARIADRPADRIAIARCRDRRRLRDQADRGEAALRRIVHVERVVIERRERTDRCAQHRHRMRVVMETVEEVLQRLAHHRVMRDLVLELAELGLGRQVAVDQQVGDFEKARVLGQLLDRVPAIQQYALVAVDERDRAAARCRRHEPRIVGEVAGVLVELADVDRRIAEAALDDRQGRGLVRRGIGQQNALIRHGEISWHGPAHCEAGCKCTGYSDRRIGAGTIGPCVSACALSTTTNYCTSVCRNVTGRAALC